MRNSNITSVFLLVVLFFCLLMLYAMCFSTTETVHSGRFQSRRLLESASSLSANFKKMNGAMMEPEKTVTNGLRRQPPSSSNPTQNKVHPWCFASFLLLFLVIKENKQLALLNIFPLQIFTVSSFYCVCVCVYQLGKMMFIYLIQLVGDLWGKYTTIQVIRD